jgi:transcriptional regulator with XRE-family HTH domain
MYDRYCNLRDSLGLRDADIARMTGITNSTFSDWKRGKSAPNVTKIAQIAKVLNTTTDYLITGEYEYRRRRDTPRTRPESRILTYEETNLLFLWSRLSPDQKENVNALMNSMITQKGESTDESSNSAREEVS